MEYVKGANKANQNQRGKNKARKNLRETIAKLTTPCENCFIQIPGLKRWKKGGSDWDRIQQGISFGPRNYQVAYPSWCDGPILKWLFEHDLDNQYIPNGVVDDNGVIINRKLYGRWEYIKLIGHHIATKLKEIPDLPIFTQ